MRIIGWKVVTKMVPWSRQHVKRLEDTGKFPLRVQLGENRVGWVESEILKYIEEKANDRYADDSS